MKVLFLVFCAVVGVVGAFMKCHQGATAAAAKEPTECASEESYCHRPGFIEYTGYAKKVPGTQWEASDFEFACGPCYTGNGPHAGCKDTQGESSNAPIAGTHTFECTNFIYDPNTGQFAAQPDATICNALEDTIAICNSNGETADNAYTVKNAGCGPCVESEKTAKKCAEWPVLTFECSNFNYDATTMKFVADQNDLTTCKATKKVCNSNGETADNAYTVKKAGCGPCVELDKTAKKCAECDGDNCNAPVLLTFECTNFNYDAKTEKYVAEKDLTTCKATKKVCNSNGEAADNVYTVKGAYPAYKVQNAGCGPCVPKDKEDKKCVECDGDNCNSAATITAFILPIIALFYTLF